MPLHQPLNTRLHTGKALLAPGIYDVLTALIAQQAGFEALYLSGASIAYTQFGHPDIGLTTATETIQILEQITDKIDTPIIVDGDTGFGNAINTQRTIRHFERAGAAMIQLEDQSFPKRCGHLADKQLISCQEMCGKLKAALDARHSADTLIMARTDAIAVKGFDAALERANAYIECGVDALFIEAPQTVAHMNKICESFSHRIPLLANMVEGGQTPVHSVANLQEKGYRIVIFPGGTARFIASRLQHYYQTLKDQGSTKSLWPEMLDFNELNNLIGTPALLDNAKQYENA